MSRLWCGILAYRRRISVIQEKEIDEAIKKIRVILLAVKTSRNVQEAERWVKEEIEENRL